MNIFSGMFKSKILIYLISSVSTHVLFPDMGINNYAWILYTWLISVVRADTAAILVLHQKRLLLSRSKGTKGAVASQILLVDNNWMKSFNG